MRRILSTLACCLLPLIASAEGDTKYNASLPFRPSNITGLSNIYLWVGSVHARDRIDNNDSVCKNLQGQTFTAEYESFLAITERGPYNLGSNPVNTLLTLWNSDANLTSLSGLPWTSSSLEWYLESAPWVHYANNRSTASDAGSESSVKDVFNLTLSPDTKGPPYKLTGTIKDADLMLTSFDMDLKSCNTSTETSRNYMTLVDFDWSNNAGWTWTYPTVDFQFDSRTANFTLNGYAAGSPYLIDRSDPTRPLGPDEVQGKIKVSFFGVIDSYHSDTLVNSSSTPTWLRTVGFGNNSANIGYDNGSLGSPRPLHWGAVAVCSVVSLAFMYL
ncbi:uncharacterized protein N7515_008313 [Penicillium bovifimosum]|uniref:Uncharacterized protein n=1 Tax=Penicillium bovifimosum TaxID=126998 RepID=A0A9W9GMS5_9EURO|nr:uncharacterized protein N7515_008313 [Penicillium bovifimosum]KAJ5124488.1 hypothetical protein N7515_008313 [Penicillium bovifimosum]